MPESLPRESTQEVFTIARPTEFETDGEWARALVEEMWELRDELDEARDALHAIERNVTAWRAYLDSIAEEDTADA